MTDLIERLKAGQDLLRLFVSSWNPRQSGKTSAGQLIVDIEEAIQALQAMKDYSELLENLERDIWSKRGSGIDDRILARWCSEIGQAIEAINELSAEQESWRCFQCGEAFTDKDKAAEHFGYYQHQQPACTIDVAEYRRMEELHRQYLSEETEKDRAMYSMQSEHATALRRAEEEGYSKGITERLEHFEAQQSKPVPDIAQALMEKGRHHHAWLDAADYVRDLLSNTPKLEAEPLWMLEDELDGAIEGSLTFNEAEVKDIVSKSHRYRAIRVWREKE